MKSPQTDQAYRAARDTVTLAARQTGADALGQDAYWTLGSLRQLLTSLDVALGSFGEGLVDGACAGELTNVEGPFAGDPVESALTAHHWLDQARTSLAEARRATDNAHIAIAGIARP
ncbi:hypothetical protein EIL87_06715 [Saccharopolyspora rhizosphaerae]|uniref:ESX-1 secretion-associated protein n=1 Tax=Saccharopolyspora rhizosphaerae TaxID=2492662 RepID=A0A426JXR5_9PSEU|nr:hypothetical protein [Saccharopolyspora rhizosphaerae]RRO17957.1 hypothetical protein EIL87_06715 [Saccharopolyspora rhizosphaerae]